MYLSSKYDAIILYVALFGVKSSVISYDIITISFPTVDVRSSQYWASGNQSVMSFCMALCTPLACTEGTKIFHISAWRHSQLPKENAIIFKMHLAWMHLLNRAAAEYENISHSVLGVYVWNSSLNPNFVCCQKNGTEWIRRKTQSKNIRASFFRDEP